MHVNSLLWRHVADFGIIKPNAGSDLADPDTKR